MNTKVRTSEALTNLSELSEEGFPATEGNFDLCSIDHFHVALFAFDKLTNTMQVDLVGFVYSKKFLGQ